MGWRLFVVHSFNVSKYGVIKMTFKEVYNKLQSHYVFIAEGIFDSYDVTDKMFEAIEKQIPKIAANKKDGDISLHYDCPDCNGYLVSEIDGELCAGQKYNYCPRCGQRIDWGDAKCG